MPSLTHAVLGGLVLLSAAAGIAWAVARAVAVRRFERERAEGE